MRYFFHIRAFEGLIPDDEGTELSGIEQARAEARKDAHELALEFSNGGNGITLQAVEVVDEFGKLAWQERIAA